MRTDERTSEPLTYPLYEFAVLGYRLVSPRLASALLPLEFWVMASSLKLAMRSHLSQVISHIDAGLGKG